MYKEIVKGYYDDGIYSVEDVKIFVKAKRLTAAEFEEITGEAYTE